MRYEDEILALIATLCDLELKIRHVFNSETSVIFDYINMHNIIECKQRLYKFLSDAYEQT